MHGKHSPMADTGWPAGGELQLCPETESEKRTSSSLIRGKSLLARVQLGPLPGGRRGLTYPITEETNTTRELRRRESKKQGRLGGNRTLMKVAWWGRLQ